MRSIWMSLWLFFVVYVWGVVLVVGVSLFFATGSMPQFLSFCVCYLESGLCIRIECRVWVHFGFEVRCVNTCSYLLQRLVVGWVFTVFFGCCILFLGSAIGCWLFAATVYWMFGSVAWLLVGWWPSGWMWVMRCLLVGFFFYLGCRPTHVHDTALVSLWGCLQSVCFG